LSEVGIQSKAKVRLSMTETVKTVCRKERISFYFRQGESADVLALSAPQEQRNADKTLGGGKAEKRKSVKEAKE